MAIKTPEGGQWSEDCQKIVGTLSQTLQTKRLWETQFSKRDNPEFAQIANFPILQLPSSPRQSLARDSQEDKCDGERGKGRRKLWYWVVSCLYLFNSNALHLCVVCGSRSQSKELEPLQAELSDLLVAC